MKLPWARESPRWLRAPRSAVGIEAQTGWATDKFMQWAPARAIWVKKIQPLTQKLSAARNGGDKGEGWPRFYGFSLSTSARWTFRPSCAWTLVFFCPEDSTPAPAQRTSTRRSSQTHRAVGRRSSAGAEDIGWHVSRGPQGASLHLDPSPCFPRGVLHVG